MQFASSVRTSSDFESGETQILAACGLLDLPEVRVDADGYKCEILGAAVSATGDVAYVESRAKDVGPNPLGENQRQLDISIRVHLVTKVGNHTSEDIQSYNPFFGCEVQFFEWIDRTAVLIYREKHWTFACRFGDQWPPRFVKIEYQWGISGDVLAFVGYKETQVRRLSFPMLDPLEPLSAEDAVRIGLLANPRG